LPSSGDGLYYSRALVPWAATGKRGERGRVATGRWRLAAALCLAVVPAMTGCRSEEPALTLAFQSVPENTTRIAVTLHAPNMRFSAPDASNGKVDVSYVDGDILIGIDGGFAAERRNLIRLPLTASENVAEMRGTAVATGGVATKTATTTTTIRAHQSAMMTFDFARDGSVADAADGGGDGGADADAPSDARDGGPPGDTSADIASPDTASDIGVTDVPADMPGDVPVEMPTGDAPADMAPEMPADRAPTDVPADMTTTPDVAPDAPIPISCTATTPRAASSTPSGGGPALAATPAGLFGLAWKSSTGDILYNSFSDGGGMQNTADITVLAKETGTLGDPQLARVVSRGASQFALGFGRRESNGTTYAAVITIDPQAGAQIVGATSGPGWTDTMPPIVGGLAVNGDLSVVGLVSRRANLSARTPVQFVRIGVDPVGSGSPSPAPNLMAWATAAGWATASSKPNRFVIASIFDNSATGGTLQEVLGSNLQAGSLAYFSSPADAPVAGQSGATVSVVGIGDAVAVVWVDEHAANQEVWLAVVDLTSGNRRGAVQVSGGSIASTLPKQYPEIVFDGAVLAVAWLEIQNGGDSRIWLRRFDQALAPQGTPLAIGSTGAATFADIGLAAAGPGKYGIAFSRAGSPGTKAFSYVDCR
jgi:hypothetical protein